MVAWTLGRSFWPGQMTLVKLHVVDSLSAIVVGEQDRLEITKKMTKRGEVD